MSAKRIPRWTGRIAFVLGVIAFSIKLRVQTIRVGIDIDKHRNSIQKQHGSNCSFPGVRRSDHFVTGTNANCFQGGLDRNRTGIDALRVLDGVHFREFLGEGVGVLAREGLAAPFRTREHIFKSGALLLCHQMAIE